MKMTPLRAIKKHCLDCSGYEKKAVRECHIEDCVLYQYRMGNNPSRYRKGKIKNVHSMHVINSNEKKL